MTATHEFVVPKSMPIIFPMCLNTPSIFSFRSLRWRAAAVGGLVQPHYHSFVGYCQVLFECVGLNKQYTVCAVGKNLNKAWVAIQGSRDENMYVSVFL